MYIYIYNIEIQKDRKKDRSMDIDKILLMDRFQKSLKECSYFLQPYILFPFQEFGMTPKI